MSFFTSATRVNRLLAGSRRALLTWPRGHVLAALALGTALGACFNPPAQAVMFSCTPDDAVCPGGYSCEADGCCHRDGSDVAADFGACGLGKGASASDPGTAPTTTSATTSEPDASTSSTGTGTGTGTGTTGTSTSTDADTGADTGSSSAGTTGSARPANI